jgi:hypothetical protein
MSRTSTSTRHSDRLATLLTNLFAPAHLVIGLLLIVGATSHPLPLRGLTWGALAALLVGVLPYAWVLRAVRRGRFTSHHIPDRTQRMLPLAMAAAAVVVGLVTLALLGAPRPLVALIVAMLAGLGVTAAITRYWKVSLHAGVAAGTAAILTIVFGPGLLATGAVVAAIGWSRVHLGDHTTPQVTIGAIVGAIVAAAVFLPLR